MTMRLAWPTLLLLLAPLTGCIGGDDAGTRVETTDAVDAVVDETAAMLDATPPAADSVADPGARPTWQHGDWWEFDIYFSLGFGGPLLEGPSKVVVYDTLGGYKLGAVDRAVGVLDTYIDSFYVGALDQNLNPASMDTMFSFPLADGKKWTSSFSFFDDGDASGSVELTAASVGDAEDPLGPTPGFLVTGTADNGLAFEYVYSPLSEWVTRFTVTGSFFDDEPFVITDLRLKGAGGNFEGSFRVIARDPIYQRFVAPFTLQPDNVPVPPADLVTVAEGFTFVQRLVGNFGFAFPPFPAAVYAGHVEMVTPDNGHEEYTLAGEGVQFDILTDEPPVPGEWKVGYAVAGTGGAYVSFDGFNEEIVDFTPASHEFHGG